MRRLWLIPILTVAISAGGYALCVALGRDPHVHEMITALIISLIGAIAGVAPVVWLRHSDSGIVSQAGLAGTVAQMMLTLALAGVAATSHVVSTSTPFLVWLLAFYWALLIAVVVLMVTIVKNAKPMQKATL